MFTLDFDALRVPVSGAQATPAPGGILLQGASPALHLPSRPGKFYRHGWQSWSLTAWLEADFRLPLQQPALLRPMQTDPLYAGHPAPNGSWVGAVELEAGRILLLGALGLEAHLALRGQQLHGWYETGDGAWFVACGEERQVFAAYARQLEARFGALPRKPAPRVWCSWYSLYTAIDEPLLQQAFEGLGDLPFDVLQVDDGWQVAIGDWTPNRKFPAGMAALAGQMRATGRAAGLWLAPLLAVPSSTLFREHPGWLLRDPDGRLAPAGFNWGEPLYALDTTHPEVLDWLAALMEQVRAWGFNYIKLDFLYAGALPGLRHAPLPREAALRQGLQALRDGMGQEAYFLACGAPVLPCLGVCDALRVGPDVAGEWERYRDAVLLYNPTTPGVKNAIRTTLHRLWLEPLIATDPDVAYFCSERNSLTPAQKDLLQDLALVCNFKATSDLPAWLEASERESLRAFLEAQPAVTQTGRYTFQIGERRVDFSPAVSLPVPPRGLPALARALLAWLSNQGWVMRLFYLSGQRDLKKRIGRMEGR